jgi:hypothetical protein
MSTDVAKRETSDLLLASGTDTRAAWADVPDGQEATRP